MPQNEAPKGNERPSGIEKLWATETERLKGLIGSEPEQQPGDIRRSERGEFDFVDGKLSEEQILDRMAEILKDRRIDDFGEFAEYQRLNMLLRSLQVTASMAKGEGDASALERELIIANQAATQQEYLPEIIRQVQQFQSRYTELREFGRKFDLPLPTDIAVQEESSGLFMKALNDAMESRLVFANALNLKSQISLVEGLTGNREMVKRLGAKEPRTADEETQLSRAKLNIRLCEKLGLDETQLQNLKTQYVAALATLSASDRALVESGQDTKLQVRLNEVNQRLIDVLSGKKEAIGLKQDFIPQKMYVDLWKQFDADLLVLQKEIEIAASKKNKDPEAVIAEQQYLRNIRSTMTADLTAFTNDLGQYQMSLDELARVQNHVGHVMSLSDATMPAPTVAPKDAEALSEWLAERAKYRQQALGNALSEAEKMLEPGIAEKIEDAWNKQGEVIVTDVAVKLARIASGWMPSETNGSGVVENLFKEGENLIGMPGSREEGMEKLAGPVQEAMGWPKGKTWAELNDFERAEIKKRTKSVLDAMQNFDRTKIRNMRSTMAAIDEMHEKHPPSSFAGEIVSQNLLTTLDSQRIDHDMTGEKVGNETINRATAYILLLRQRRKDWGDPEAKTGFIGEYAKMMEALDDNIKHHLDMGGALLKMQRAYFDYAIGVLAIAGIGLLAPWVLWAIWGTATVVIPIARRVAPPMYRMGRNALGRGANLIRGLPETLRLRGTTAEALTKMRYLARERQLAQWMEGTRAGRWMSRLASVRNARVSKIGGTTMKYGLVAMIPAIGAYEAYNTRQRVNGAEGNAELQRAYADDYTTTGLETAGLLASVPLALGPQIVLTAPVMYAADYRRARSAVVADWAHDTENWIREYNSDELFTKLRNTTTANAVEAGGGGALKPRIYFPSQKDQEEAAQGIESAQAATRAKIMEAHFNKNLLLPDQSDEATKQKVIRWKMSYMKMATEGTYNDTYAYVFEQADLFAELMMRKEQMEAAGEPLLLSYFDAQENRHWLDLSKLGPSNREQNTRIVMEYYFNLRSQEEVFLFNTLGQIASEKNGAERVTEGRKTKTAVRRMVVAKLSHSIYKAESLIGEADWPGLDTIVTSGNTSSANVVRAYLAELLETELKTLIPNLLEGSLSAEKYTEVLSKCTGILQKTNPLKESLGNTRALYDEAVKHYGGDASSKYSLNISPLLNVIYETADTGQEK